MIDWASIFRMEMKRSVEHTVGMSGRSIVSPDDQKVTFVELFFDLVFVFCVTQVVQLLHGGFSSRAVFQAVLVFWLVWWAWTQFTWALNAADTTHPLVELGTLAATAIAFFMAVGVPAAFDAHSLAFAIPYIMVRGVGLYIYSSVAYENPVQHSAVRTFSIISLSGLLAVLGGAWVSGSAQYWLWGAAIALDVTAAAIGAQKQGWNLHPEHFGERHGLFVIIALGETLIVAASGLSGADLAAPSIAAGILSVSITCGLWWIYFTRTKPALDHALESRKDVDQSSMARDVFSLLHFPMLCGVIAYAFSIEEAMRHPLDPFDNDVRCALAFGILLFIGGMNAAMWRAGGPRLLPRLLIATGTSASVLLVPVVAPVSLVIVLLGVCAIAIIEERTFAAGGSGKASEASVGNAG